MTIIVAKSSEYLMNLIDQCCCRKAKFSVKRASKKFEKIADGKRISPKIPLRIVCSRRKARSPSKGTRQPSYRCRFMFRCHSEDNYSPKG
jgi:hypothetical protein